MDSSQVKRACGSLLDYLKRRKASKGAGGKSSLFDAEDVLSADDIQLVVGLKRTPEQGRAKPIRVPIPHSLYRPQDGASICMFVKDNSEELQAKLRKDPVAGLERVVSLSALRRNYKQFSDRRRLMAAHDLFVADDRITPMLTKALGKTFLSKKKQPVAVRLTRGSLKRNIETARDSTYLFLGWGPCSTVKIARTDFPVEKVVENCLAAVEGIVAKVPRKWKNIQSIHIKSVDSIALPIFNSLPDAVLAESADEAERTTKRKSHNSGDGSGEGGAADDRHDKKKRRKQKSSKTAVSERFSSMLQEAEDLSGTRNSLPEGQNKKNKKKKSRTA